MLEEIDTPAKSSAAGATREIVSFIGDLAWSDLDASVRHAAKRHLLDTIGVMIAGAQGDLAHKVERVLAEIRPPGEIPVPGRRRRADLLEAAYLGGAAGHGIELDDGYRQGSAHPGVAVIPAALATAYKIEAGGEELLTAIVAGYEVMIAVSAACHPNLRQRGFHPTGATGVFGAMAASARLRRLTFDQTEKAFGLAASGAAGLFAFINGGADVKRLHAGHASREGLLAVLLAEMGVEGPPKVLEARDGFAQAFAFDRAHGDVSIATPPRTPFQITDCYVKPYACCRHIQPAVEALIDIVVEHGLDEREIRSVDVETYNIASEHAHTGWTDYAEAQLSFPFILALGMRYRWIKLEHFDDRIRKDAEIARLCGLVHVRATPEQDARYPRERPARVTVTTDRGAFTKQATEALGARELPFDDERLTAKFRDMTEAAIGREQTDRLLEILWSADQATNVRELIEGAALPA